ncbi:MAG TPA: FtsX-like permease family protein, partial [Thermoanaerobaculia bacterium]|nr:FtsX-like permease family protein [Thermoanaerobaculia bacterium]
ERSRSTAGGGSGRGSLARLLVVGQVAASLLLLAGAGLFVRSLRNLQTADLGYESHGLLMLGVDPESAGYAGDRVGPMLGDLLARLAAVPGVAAVSVSENGIFSGTESSTAIVIAGRPPRDDDEGVAYDRVGPRYFETVGIPILRGRGIGPRDVAGAPPVAVVNEAMAREYFPGEDPLGHRFAEKSKPDVVYEIVGISTDARDHDLRGEVGPRYYAPLLQTVGDVSAFNVELRTGFAKAAGDSPRLEAAIRDAARAVDPRLRVIGPLAVERSIEAWLRGDRLVATLATVLGLLALVLASIGLYGVVAHATARRTNEIGIRMVMGARRRAVVWMVLRETLLLAGAGIAVGLVAVLGSARLVASRLHGLSPHDAPTLAAAALVLLVVGLVAGSIPGARAARIDPMRSLRQE